MSYYQYYQQQPQWGTSSVSSVSFPATFPYQIEDTSPTPLTAGALDLLQQQYQVVTPPRPNFQPQPNWGGSQYFRAQAGYGYDDYDDRDDGFFDNIWRGIKDIFNRGFSREEAALWHRRVYGGTMPIDGLDPAQLGAAAGFEAFRHWSTYRSTYRSPLADDRDREREALAGLAAGEAVKLISLAPRPRSRHSRREAAEVAAATAERILADEFDDPYEPYESNPYRNRRRSIRRRSSSFSYPAERPIVATSTGGTLVSSQPTGASYVSGQSAGYAMAQPTTYPQQMQATPGATYVTSTGQPVQYVQAGTQYPGTQYAGTQYPGTQPTYVTTTGQPLTYATGQPQYATSLTGQPVTYATTGGTYATATPGYSYAQQPQVLQAGQPQVVYANAAQPGTQYMTMPQGYQRARALSVGYSGQPATYVQYR
ncbi:hypothetical protein FRB99_004230 [Tulasnella sp. 403]|nr:hypothetical protein FRB99_004230 [Tulasnella sp. 403]